MKRLKLLLLALLPAMLQAEDLEIIVTASRVEEDAATVPAYVRVIPEEEIQDGYTVLDALNSIPDISIKSTSPGNAYVSMGGFGDNGFGRTLILINGRPINRPDMAGVNWELIPLERVKRIEVVKGAMSSLYGDQAIAGAINIITEIDDGLDIDVAASGASTLSNRQSVYGSWKDEQWNVSISGARVDQQSSRDRSDSRTWRAGLGGGVNLGPISAELNGFYANNYYELPGALTEAQFDADPDKAVNQDDEVKEVRYGADLALDLELGAFNLSMPLSISKLESVADMVSWPGFTDSQLTSGDTTLQFDGSLFAGDSWELSPIIGFDFNGERLDIQGYGDLARTVKNADNRVERFDLALWGRFKANHEDSLILDAGVRGAYVSLKTDTADPVVFITPVWDAGVAWLPLVSTKLSLRYGRVARYPFLDEQVSYYFDPPTVNTDLKPEKGHSITGSASWTKQGFSLEMAPYLIYMQDEIAYDTVSYNNINIGTTWHFGASAEAAWESEHWNLKSGYSLDRAQFDDTGKTVPLVPMHNIFGKVAWTPLKSLRFSTDARFSSAFYEGGDNDNSHDMISGRLTWNLGATWTPNGGWRITLQLLNILDDRTPSNAFYSAWSGTHGWYPSSGRSLDLGVAWSY